MIIAGMASFKLRRDVLRRTLTTVLPQVDRLILYLNDYASLPREWVGMEGLDKVKVIPGHLNKGDIGDVGKFWVLQESRADDVVVTLDDDILYPPDLVSVLLRGLSEHRGCAVSCHGATLPEYPLDYYKSRTQYHAKNAQEVDLPVHVVGTGITAFVRSTVKFGLSAFSSANMADIWFAVAAKKQGLPLVCLRRAGGWIQPLPVRESIYDSSKMNDSTLRNTALKQAMVVKTEAPWPALPHVIGEVDLRIERLRAAATPQRALPEKSRVSVFTYQRAEAVQTLLKQISVQQAKLGYRGGDISVCVYDDASPNKVSAAVVDACSQYNFEYVRAARNLGKKGFWRTWNTALKDCQASDAGFFYFLPDDCQICEDFFTRVPAYWDSLSVANKATLDLHIDAAREKKPCWTGIEPKRQVTQTGAVYYETGWQDGFLYAPRDTFSSLRWELAPIQRNWNASGVVGSGVGAQISKRLVSQNKKLLRGDVSFVKNVAAVSQMNGGREADKTGPLHRTVRFLDDLVKYTVKGLTYYSIPGDHIERVLRAGALYEPDLMQVFDSLDLPRGSVVLDCGAHWGMHTIKLAKENRVDVVAVEANERNYSILVKNVAANMLTSSVKTRNIALAEGDGTRKSVVINPWNTGMSVVEDGEGVNAMRADGLGITKQVSLIKIDCETTSLEVLRSCAGLIAQWKPSLAIELVTAEELEMATVFLQAFGYKQTPKVYCRTPVYVWDARLED